MYTQLDLLLLLLLLLWVLLVLHTVHGLRLRLRLLLLLLRPGLCLLCLRRQPLLVLHVWWHCLAASGECTKALEHHQGGNDHACSR
jgi:hypothetical protein